jgi:PST family polysaccharide transporter
VRQAIAFSRYVLTDRIAWYIYMNADFLVVGKMLGRSALGGYGFASTLANMPTDKVTALIGNVTTSIFSAVQREPAALRRYLLALTEGLALVTFPATLGLALVADDFVLGVLGEQWRLMIAPLQILAGYAAVRSLIPLLPQVLFVTGDARFVMRTSIATAAILPIAFLIGSRWGTVGIAAAWLIIHPFLAAPLYVRVFRTLDISVDQYLLALRPAVAGVAIMAGIILGVSEILPVTWPLWLRAVLQVVVGGLVYVGTILMLRGERLRAFYRAWRPASG